MQSKDLTSVTRDALVCFCDFTLLAVGGFIILPSKETDHHHLQQHIENNQKHPHSWCFVQDVRQFTTVGLKMNPHERHMTGRWLQAWLKEEREPQGCSMFKELEHVPNGVGHSSHSLPAGSDGLFSWFDSELTWFYIWECYVYPAMSSDTLIRVYLMRGVANSSQTRISGTCCLFSRNLQKSVFTWLEERIHSLFHHTSNALGETTAANQTDKALRGPSTQYRARHTVGT